MQGADYTINSSFMYLQNFYNSFFQYFKIFLQSMNL